MAANQFGQRRAAPIGVMAVSTRVARPVPVAVNVSPIQLRYGDFPDMVFSVLGAAIKDTPIEIEITESVMICSLATWSTMPSMPRA